LASEFGVIDVDPSGINQDGAGKIRDFLEKPQNAHGLPDSPNEVLASMGNYVANVPALVEALHRDHGLADAETKHDMGGDIVPYFVSRGECGFYDFTYNDVPGSTDRDRNYWQDVGTVDAYYESNMDLIASHPVFNLYNSAWPLHTGYIGLPPAKVVHDGTEYEGRIGSATDSIISPGVIISGGRVDDSILSPGVRINSYSEVSASILLDNVIIGRHAKVKKAILDKYVIVDEGVEIGYDIESDRAKGLTVTESGVVVIPKSTHVTKDGLEPTSQYGRMFQ
jgi:glucose-1-phosphate adenylyltransferase